ncbi:MAG: hypothetical protein ACLPWF_31725 [Bryobacteraceae bacterium]
MDADLQQAFAQLEARLTARIETFESRLRTHIDERNEATETKLKERIEATETKLLTAFHNWASPSEARQRTHAAALRAIDLEMEALSERVAKLEGKKPH